VEVLIKDCRSDRKWYSGEVGSIFKVHASDITTFIVVDGLHTGMNIDVRDVKIVKYN
jgi:hypothetical protein